MTLSRSKGNSLKAQPLKEKYERATKIEASDYENIFRLECDFARSDRNLGKSERRIIRFP